MSLRKAIEEVRQKTYSEKMQEELEPIEEATNMYTDDITGFQIDRFAGKKGPSFQINYGRGKGKFIQIPKTDMKRVITQMTKAMNAKQETKMKDFFELREGMINEDQAYHKAAIKHHDYHSKSHDTEVRNTDEEDHDDHEEHMSDHDHKMNDHDNASDAHKAAHDAHKKHGGDSSQYKAAAKKAHTASKEAHADTPDFHAIDKPTQSKFKLRKTH